MKLQLVKPSAAATIGLLLTAPTAYFIFVSVLKYVFRLPALFDAIEPLLTSMGAKEPLGLNINLLIVFGPALTFLINLTSILNIQWNRNEGGIHIHLIVQQKPVNWIVLCISGGCLALLFLYALGENCNC
jgi:hypothetical protein